MSLAQATFLQAAINGQDLLVRAKTGSGKTIGFLLPIVTRLLSTPRPPPPHPKQGGGKNGDGKQGGGKKGDGKKGDGKKGDGKQGGGEQGGPVAVVMAPARELAEQTAAEAARVGGKCGLRAVTLIGGARTPTADEVALSRGFDVIVATPGRLNDHLSDPRRTIVREALRTRGVVLVLDEADRLLDPGFVREVMRVHEAMPAPGRQTLLFTATVPPGVRDKAKQLLRADNAYIDAGGGGDGNDDGSSAGAVANEHVRQEAVVVAPGQLLNALWSELTVPPGAAKERSVVFVQTLAIASLVTELLRKAAVAAGSQLSVFELHSGMDQKQRSKSIAAYVAAPPPTTMVATDVFARGIDVKGIGLVLQLGIAPDAAQVVHRVGRTGRGGAKGRALMILADDEEPVLRQLIDRDGMPIGVRVSGAPSAPEPSVSPAFSAAMKELAGRLNERSRPAACRAYVSTLGFYKAQQRRLRWTEAQLRERVAARFAPLGVVSPQVCTAKK
jgi:ATP-dependent RNA helicase MSS116